MSNGESSGKGVSRRTSLRRRLIEAPARSDPYATARGAAAAKESLERSRRLAGEQAPGAPLDLLGLVEGLPAGTVDLPWPGRALRLVEHEAHAPGHASVVIPGSGVLLAGDMLPDVEIPLLDARLPEVGAYLTALDRLDAAVVGISTLVPGHGAVARGEEVVQRLRADRAYVEALRRGEDPPDARLDPDATYGRDWLPGAHRQNLRIARS